MPYYRKKPVVIEAVQNTLDAGEAMVAFLGEASRNINWSRNAQTGGMAIVTLEGTMHADVGDFIIRGVKGEFYPCKPDIFAQTYEPAEDRK